ncbi:MFS transporter [Rhodococcus sp. RS1C4]|uniref:MDR family MFS transporter n=1 Tax=Nocardiaceae TaxID=85025 RepID=UPI00037BCF24|nr:MULTISPECIES: MDR family MFS transporter [Rhodococcus]OZC50010.1 MFS transporter [Rhodococcus sp. 06-621-2]OZC54529.1 MFS transporter [Rhodococcus sp. RS1C4]OZC75527.1 MFS transporter [Rhodococcus sp. 06-418-1B]OZD12325.1 MFS transporter [Rhodococcus sp. 06-156-3C]OZD19009.1 MFS transporter [Rhodococcus sp. 06-156-4C]
MSTTEAPPNIQQADPDAMSHRQILEALTGLLAALFTALLSTTIVSTALPTIIGDLQGSQTAYSWVITTALLANAASTPIWGKLADLFNKKVLVQSAIVIFVAGSLIAGFAHNVPLLLVARVIQGIGMGGLTALVIAIIGTIVSPRDRGRYSGYTGAVMAVSMSGGPILGGVIVDSPLGWRWCFFVCVPLAVIALGLLQKTLHIKTERKENVSIDWLGALLLTAGVSVLLVWVSFAGKADYYAWISRETAYLVGGGVLLLVLTVIVEAKAKSPIIPLKIVTERTTGLAIIASIAVGVGLFGATTFLGQYFQTARGYTPTEAGLLSIPLVFGMLVASVGSGQLITKFGKWKPFIVTGSVLLVIGFLLLGTIDHATSLWTVGVFITIVGLGTGMLMQNLVLAVQNTVSVHNIGAASSTVAFFRTFGGAIGVSVLGSLLATRVAEKSAAGLAQLGVDSSGSAGGGSLDLSSLPAPILAVVRTAYGDATGRIFMIAGFVAIVTLLAVIMIPNRPLRKTIDFAQAPVEGEETIEVPSFGDTREYVAAELDGTGRHEAPAGSAPFEGLSTDARDRLLNLLLPEPKDTLEALDEAEAIRAEVVALQQELDAKMLDFDAVCERLRRLGLSEDQIARVLGDAHVPDPHQHYVNSGLNGHSVN